MALPGNVLTTSEFGDSSTHLVNLLQYIGLLEKFFLTSSLNVPTRSWWLLSLVIPSEEFHRIIDCLHSFCNSPLGSAGLQLDLSLPHNLLFVTQNKSSSLNCSVKSPALGFSCHGGLPQTPLWLLSSLLELWRGKPDTLFQVLSYQHWAETFLDLLAVRWKWPVWDLLYLWSESMPLAHFQLGTNGHLQVLFSKAKMSLKIDASLERGNAIFKTSNNCFVLSPFKKEKKFLWHFLASM